MLTNTTFDLNNVLVNVDNVTYKVLPIK